MQKTEPEAMKVTNVLELFRNYLGLQEMNLKEVK